MIHSELCSACGGPLQLSVGLVFISVTEEDVERRNCLAKSCPYCVRNSPLEDQKHSIVIFISLYHMYTDTERKQQATTALREVIRAL